MICCSRIRKRFICRVCFDVFCIGLVAAGMLSLKFGANPYHRGFFCDDESIKHPYLHDTVTSTTAALVGAFLPILTIILVEALFRKNRKLAIFTQSPMFLRKKSWMMSSYDYIVVFIFGMAVNQFLTDVGKFSIGRLRPHFLTLCDPDFTKIDCRTGYITSDVCRSTDDAQLKESRLSFPSGHSSYSMYCMMFAIIYIQTRLSCKRAPLLKPTLQVVFFSLAFFTCLSRISDYKHHWSDVLSGAILGVFVCLCIVRSLTDFGKLLFVPRVTNDVHMTEILSSPSGTFSDLNDTGYNEGGQSYSSQGHPGDVVTNQVL